MTPRDLKLEFPSVCRGVSDSGNSKGCGSVAKGGVDAPIAKFYFILQSIATVATFALVAATLALVAVPAGADVFVWKDPQTGRTRMSNIAPAWVRDPQPGQRAPKVEVVRDRKVIDVQTAFAAPQEAARPSEKQMAMGKRAQSPAAVASGVAAATDDDD